MTASIDYVLVNRFNGEIEVCGRCQHGDLDTQPEAAHQVKVVGYGTPATHYFTPLGLCEYTPEQRAAKALRPPHSRWDNAQMRWIDVRPCAELRAERWAIVKAARTAATDAPIDTPFGRFDADPSSRAALGEAFAVQDATATVTWTTADNTLVTLFRADLAELLRLVDQRTQQAHSQARVLRSRIEAALDVADLEAITWPQAP